MQLSIFVICLILPFCLSGSGKPRIQRDSSEIEVSLQIVAIALRHYNFQLRKHSIETSILADILVVNTEVARTRSLKNRNVIPSKYRHLVESKSFKDWERQISKYLGKKSVRGGTGKISSRGNTTVDLGLSGDEGNSWCFGFCLSQVNLNDMLRCLPIKWRRGSKVTHSGEQGKSSNGSKNMMNENRIALSIEKLDSKIRPLYPAIYGHIEFLFYGIFYGFHIPDWELEYIVANIEHLERKINNLLLEADNSREFQQTLEFYAFAAKSLTISIRAYVGNSNEAESSIDDEGAFTGDYH